MGHSMSWKTLICPRSPRRPGQPLCRTRIQFPEKMDRPEFLSCARPCPWEAAWVLPGQYSVLKTEYQLLKAWISVQHQGSTPTSTSRGCKDRCSLPGRIPVDIYSLSLCQPPFLQAHPPQNVSGSSRKHSFQVSESVCAPSAEASYPKVLSVWPMERRLKGSGGVAVPGVHSVIS